MLFNKKNTEEKKNLLKAINKEHALIGHYMDEMMKASDVEISKSYLTLIARRAENLVNLNKELKEL